MTVEYFLILSILIIFFAIITYLLNKKLNTLNKNNDNQVLTQWLSSLQQSIDVNNRNINQVLTQNNKNINETLTQTTSLINQRLDNAARVIAQTSQEIGKVSELGTTMKDLQLLLQSPKLRGNIGEEILEDMLAQIFPKQKFSVQYAFKNGEKADAVIKTSAGILAIDAKFPMENFQKMLKSAEKKERTVFETAFAQDVKKHIKAVSTKYINQTEGTVDFALMYIPSETVFYQIVQMPNLLDFARNLRVYPVSPNTLYIHLQTILLSFEGQKLEAKSKQVMKLLRTLQKDYGKIEESFQVLGKHLTNASNQYSNASQQFLNMGQKLNYQDLLEEGEKND
ncbi:DNA recombination protein RmuC [Candidatus Beckwithbacteria bacterium]|nr:DNA recombination protein RmuC [Candidatus Beckwithbacteria bacterium]